MGKQCNKCSVDLVVGENIPASRVKRYIYICKACNHKANLIYQSTESYKAGRRAYHKLKYEENKNGVKNRVDKYFKQIDAGVYGIFSDCKLIYIGQSMAPYRRKVQHFSKRTDLNQAKLLSPISYALSVGDLQRDKLRFKMFKFIDDTSTRQQQEAELIQRYKPLYNEVYV